MKYLTLQCEKYQFYFHFRLYADYLNMHIRIIFSVKYQNLIFFIYHILKNVATNVLQKKSTGIGRLNENVYCTIFIFFIGLYN